MTKKNFLLLLIIILLIASVPVIKSFSGTDTNGESYSSILQKNWDISLPTSAQFSEVYQKDNAGFHGDGIRYHVFSYENDEPADSLVAWANDDTETPYAGSISDAVLQWLEEIDVPQEWHPEYESCSFYYCSHSDSSELILLRNSDEKMLYVAESFL